MLQIDYQIFLSYEPKDNIAKFKWQCNMDAPNVLVGSYRANSQCMPDKYKCEDPVQDRNYYLGEKMYMAVWTRKKAKYGLKQDNVSFRKKNNHNRSRWHARQIALDRLKYYRKNDYFKFNELGSEDFIYNTNRQYFKKLQE